MAATQTPDKYASDWKSIAEGLPKLVRDDGFNYLRGGIPGQTRARLAGARSPCKVLRKAAKAEGSLVRAPSDNARGRTLLLKTLSHLYFYENGGNNARVALDPDFPAVRTLTMDQCLTNADSWAFFCADAAGALGDNDRIKALGSKLYADSGWRPTQKIARTVVAQAR